MEPKRNSKATPDASQHSEYQDSRARNRALKEHTEWLIHEIMRSPVALARLADPVKRK